eukprot:2870102-Rhodomonas_salina.3
MLPLWASSAHLSECLHLTRDLEQSRDGSQLFHSLLISRPGSGIKFPVSTLWGECQSPRLLTSSSIIAISLRVS